MRKILLFPSLLMLAMLCGCESALSQGGDISDKLTMAALLLVIGIPNVVAPEAIWKITSSISYRQKMPSDFMLKVNRVVGVLLSLAGVACLFL